jgi:hypothetical protein
MSTWGAGYADVISDIHLEEVAFRSFTDVLNILPRTAPMLIIAGDVASADSWEKTVAFLGVCCAHYSLVIYVIGNHEYYSATGTITMKGVLTRIRGLETVFGNLKVLENESYVLQHLKIVIFGATMWSDVDPKIFPTTIPIFTSERRHITFDEWKVAHYTARLALRNAILLAEQLKYRLVVVTHYAPLIKETLEPKYHGDPKNGMYCTDLSSYFSGIDMWIYGHTGFNATILRGKTFITSNQYNIAYYVKQPALKIC